MIHYILQVIAFQLLFLLVYDLFLKKETFFNTNRAYLIVTPLVSFLLPFIQLAFIRENVPTNYVIELPEVVLSGEPSVVGITNAYTGGWFNLNTIWIVGMVFSLMLFLWKILKIAKLRYKGKSTSFSGFKVVLIPNSTMAFSFFRNIFLGEEISEEQRESILIHEKAHVKEYHSLDLLFFEVLRILCWFNPLLYVYQKRMTLLQEYIADRHVTEQKPKKEYYQELLSQVFQTEKISFINTFFNHSLIKNRIVMLQKSNSKKIVQLKYLLLIPVVCGMLFYTSCAQESNAQEASLTTNTSDSEIIRNIDAVMESVAKKGGLTKEEEDALKVLYVMTSGDGSLHTKEFDDVKDKINIPFLVIEKVPTYPGCEGLTDNEALKKCFTQGISKEILDKFDAKIGDRLNLEGDVKIKVNFKVDRQGNVVDVKAKAPHPDLEAEAERVLKALPQMLPGEHDGKKVGVQYTLPIKFNLKG